MYWISIQKIMVQGYKVLLGGLGDDAHSIGSTLIKLALEDNGYTVSYLGIQNTIKDFIKYSEQHDIIFISCINGHSELYLDNDEYDLRRIQYKGNKLWYVGGNLSVDKSDDYIIKLYREKGFTSIFPKPISIEEILYHLRKDIEQYHIYPEYTELKKLNYIELNSNIIEQSEGFILQDKFEALRNKILVSWPTGKGVTYETAKNNHRGTTNMDQVLYKASRIMKDPIIQPRTGVADHDKQYKLLDSLRSKGIGIASVQLDAASRRTNFKKAEEGLERSVGSDTSVLNGYPVPVHGIQGVYKLSHMDNLPFQIRGGAPDHRFVYEVGMAGGASGVEGGFLCYLLPYDKSVNPYQSMLNWKYIDILCANYHKYINVTINREFFGPLTTTLLEPSIPIVINIIESLSAAAHGVKSISVGIAEQGNRNQDIAAIHILNKLTRAYLKKYGHVDVHVTTVFHQYMAAFPWDETKAEKLIEESAVTAALSQATRIMTKTPVEAFKIPDALDNSRGIMLTQKGFKKAKGMKINTVSIEREKAIIETEVVSIMKMVEILGSGNIELGAIKALLQGIIDVPFSPNIYNCGNVIGFRNINGAIRFAKHDKLPFPEWIREIHNNDLHSRMEYERDNKLYSIIEKDLTRITKGNYKQWPLEEL